MIPRRYQITDEQWELIKDMFPPYQTGRPSKLSNRTMFNAFLWIARSGAAWRDLPEERYGSWKTAYGSEAIRNWITNKQATYTTPPKTNSQHPWKVDWYRYKERHLVECFFNKIKHFRRVATRYDKLAKSFLAFIYSFHF